MSLKDLITEHFDQLGHFQYEDLLSQDQRQLAKAYILENEDIVHDILDSVHVPSMVYYLSDLCESIESCDVFSLATDLRNAILYSKDIPSLVNGLIDHYWRTYRALTDYDKYGVA